MTANRIFQDAFVRWTVKSDLPAVLAIDARSFSAPWDKDEFSTRLRKRNCISQVVEVNLEVAGQMTYELYSDRIDLVRLAVAPRYRGLGLGRLLVERLVSKLSPCRRAKLQCVVDEDWLGAQTFLRHMEFECIDIERYHADSNDYVFERTADQPARMCR